ncbi:hypothetical protein [Marinimicrobium sp. ABcell2]|uniref:hypothetical protein n=1 Tax=Marinimicrobium sp. ABcell2 TaxID=3069751 RepID=UPI0027B24042|nr:hypothetical protein [Marinimicrobium sp. ABcell2]MDQ2077554.1 hypothetical protein [Marinimicrobium sp. ABcell2]
MTETVENNEDQNEAKAPSDAAQAQAASGNSGLKGFKEKADPLVAKAKTTSRFALGVAAGISRRLVSVAKEEYAKQKQKDQSAAAVESEAPKERE